MRHIFNELPPEMKAEIRSHLDQISLIILRHTLLGKELPERLTSQEQYEAISHGLKLSKFFYEKNLLNVSGICHAGARLGMIDVIEWGLSIGSYISEKTAFMASSGGQLECLKWLKEHNYPMDHQTCWIAAQNGHKNTLLWLFEYYPPHPDVISSAIYGNHFELVRWLHLLDLGNTWTVCAAAAQINNFKMLKWLREKGYSWNAQICYWAAHNGNIQMLAWLIQNGCQMDASKCFQAAAKKNHRDVIEWLMREGYEWDTGTCSSAKDLSLLKWLRDKNCPWNERTCSEAARRKRFDIVKWAHEEGCSWDQDTIYWVAKHGHREFLEWLITEGCPRDLLELGLIKGKNLELLKWAHQQGLFGGAHWFRRIVQTKNLEMVEWFTQTFSPNPTNTVDTSEEVLNWLLERKLLELTYGLCMQATVSGKLHRLIWLRKHNCPWYPEDCISEAKACYARKNRFKCISQDYLRIIQWIQANL